MDMIHYLRRIDAKLDLALADLRAILRKEDTMSAELDALTAQVEAVKTVDDSAIALLNGLSQQIKDLAASGGTPAQFRALADSLDANKQRLAAAVAANTPSPPAPQAKRQP